MIFNILILRRSFVTLLLTYLGVILFQLFGLFVFKAYLPLLLLQQIQFVVVLTALLFFVSICCYTCYTTIKKDSAVAVNLFFILVKMAISLSYVYYVMEAKEAYYQEIIGVFLFQYFIHLIIEVLLKKNLLE